MTPAGDHPRHRLSDVVHQPVRFSILAGLAAAETLDFSDLRDAVQVSDSVLSKQLSVLEEAGFIKVLKYFVGKRPRTSISLTKSGRKAWLEHLEVLREIAGSGDGGGTPGK